MTDTKCKNGRVAVLATNSKSYTGSDLKNLGNLRGILAPFQYLQKYYPLNVLATINTDKNTEFVYSFCPSNSPSKMKFHAFVPYAKVKD